MAFSLLLLGSCYRFKSSLVYGFTENSRRWNIAQLWKLFLYISGSSLEISFWNCVSSLLSTHFITSNFYRSSRFSQKTEPFIQLKNQYGQVDFSCVFFVLFLIFLLLSSWLLSLYLSLLSSKMEIVKAMPFLGFIFLLGILSYRFKHCSEVTFFF